MLSFVALVLAVSAGVQSKSCLDTVNQLDAKRPLLGAFRPKCNSDGTYQEMQSHEGYYFCVFPNTGEKILGTAQRFKKLKSCKLTKCYQRRHDVLKLMNRGMVGAFKPDCKDDGSFEPTQCHSSTGYCFCVYTDTGNLVKGTYQQERLVKPTNCHTFGAEQKSCKDVVNELDAKPPLMGAFRPKCQSDGRYAEMQSQEGFYFCVFPDTGKEILGTRKFNRLEKPKSCKFTPCYKERHNYLSRQTPRLGAFRAKCNDAGEYEKMQCFGSVCYCVNPNSGKEISGTRVPIGRNPSC